MEAAEGGRSAAQRLRTCVEYAKRRALGIQSEPVQYSIRRPKLPILGEGPNTEGPRPMAFESSCVRLPDDVAANLGAPSAAGERCAPDTATSSSSTHLGSVEEREVLCRLLRCPVDVLSAKGLTDSERLLLVVLWVLLSNGVVGPDQVETLLVHHLLCQRGRYITHADAVLWLGIPGDARSAAAAVKSGVEEGLPG